MSADKEPETPMDQLKRRALQSPYSAASPQHRRPLKALREQNENDSGREQKPYSIFQPHEADPNIEQTFLEQSYRLEDTKENDSRDEVENTEEETSEITMREDADTSLSNEMHAPSLADELGESGFGPAPPTFDATFLDSTQPLHSKSMLSESLAEFIKLEKQIEQEVLQDAIEKSKRKLESVEEHCDLSKTDEDFIEEAEKEVSEANEPAESTSTLPNEIHTPSLADELGKAGFGPAHPNLDSTILDSIPQAPSQSVSSETEVLKQEKQIEQNEMKEAMELYKNKVNEAETYIKLVEEKLKQTEEQRAIAQKERDDYEYLHSELRKKCNRLERERNEMQEKQLNQSSLDSLEFLKEKLDCMMKESEEVIAAKEKLQLDLQHANERTDQVTKISEERAQTNDRLEAELRLQNQLLEEAKNESRRLLVELKEMEAAKEKLYLDLEQANEKADQMTKITEEHAHLEAQLQLSSELMAAKEKLLLDLQQANERAVQVTKISEERAQANDRLEAELRLQNQLLEEAKNESRRLLVELKEMEAAKEKLYLDLEQANEKADQMTKITEEHAHLEAQLQLSSELMAAKEKLLLDLQQANERAVQMTKISEERAQANDRLEAELRLQNQLLEEAKNESRRLLVELKEMEAAKEKLYLDLEQANEKADQMTKITEEHAHLEAQLQLSSELMAAKEKLLLDLQQANERAVQMTKISEERAQANDRLEAELRLQNQLLEEAKNESKRRLDEMKEIEATKEKLYMDLQLTNAHADNMAKSLNEKLNTIMKESEEWKAGKEKLQLELQQADDRADEMAQQLVIHTEKAQRLEVEIQVLRQKDRLEKQFDELKRCVEEGFSKLSGKTTDGDDDQKLWMEEAQKKIESYQNKIVELELALAKKTESEEKAWKMCDEMDELENNYKKSIGELSEEIQRLKEKCGESKKVKVLQEALRPDNVRQLSPGSVNNSIDETKDIAATPKATRTKESEKTFMDGMDQTRFEHATRSPASTSACKQQ